MFSWSNFCALLAFVDIFIISGQCKSSDIFICDPTQTIPKSRVCDGHKDCANGYDELNCGSCTFKNKDPCGFLEEIPVEVTGYSFRFGNNTTGPKKDPHGTTNFLVAQAYHNSKYIESSKLYSPSINGAQSECMVHFYYNMNGNTSKSSPDKRWSHLSIFINRSSEETEIWNSDAFNVDIGVWNSGKAFVGRVRDTYKLTFKAKDLSPSLAPDQFGYVALADIIMTGCTINEAALTRPCSNVSEFSCANKKCISKSFVCDFSDDCGDGSDETFMVCSNYKLRCDFENGMCDWGLYRKDSWKIDGGFAHLIYGATRDHTKGNINGKYLSLHSSPSANISSKISGPILESSSKCRITFWYSMEGNSTNNGSLSISVEDLSTGIITIIWKTYPVEFPLMTFGFVRESVNFLNKLSSSFRVLFTGELSATGSSSQPSYIAIDDISFSPECKVSSSTQKPVHSSTTPMKLLTSTHSSFTTISLSRSLFCDFESGTLCNWKNNPHLYSWTVTYPGANNEKNSNSKMMPKADHTLKSMMGHFAYLSHESEDTNLLRKAIMKATDNGQGGYDGPVCLTLWYFMRTNGEAQLNVTAIAQDDSEENVVVRKNDHGDKWNKLQFEILDVKRGYLFEISAFSKLGVVAIDDIAMEPGSCMGFQPAM